MFTLTIPHSNKLIQKLNRYFFRRKITVPSLDDCLRFVDFDKPQAQHLKDYAESLISSPRGFLFEKVIRDEAERLKEVQRHITLYRIEQDIKDFIDCDWEEIQEELDHSERISQYADSCCPIYNYDILSVAQSELWLALESPDWECDSPLSSIQANIINHLQTIGHDYISEKLIV